MAGVQSMLMVGSFVALAWWSFRWRAMGRATWAVYWGLVALFFCVSFFRPFPGQGVLPVSTATVAGLSNAVLSAVVLLPPFLLGAWARRRAGRQESARSRE